MSDKKTFHFKRNIYSVIFFLFGLLLPTQLGKHFWPPFAFVEGVRSDYLSPTIYLTDIVLIVLSLLNYQKTIHAVKKIPPRTLILLIGLLGIYFFITPSKGLFFYRLFQYFKIVLVGLLVYQSTNRERAALIAGAAASGVYTLVLSIQQIASQHSLQGFWWFLGERRFSINTPDISTVSLSGKRLLRAYGTFSHPNSMGAFYLTVWWMLVLFKKHRLMAGVALAVVILSFSKIALVTLALLLVALAIFKKNPCFFCTLGSILFGVWLAGFAFLLRGSPTSLAERFASWQYAFCTLLKKPFGAGFGNYLVANNGSLFFSTTAQPVHNIVLLFGLEWGIVGLATVLVVLIFLIVPKKLPFSRILLLLPLIITGMFDHHWLTLPQNMLLFGIITGLSVSPPTTKKRHSTTALLENFS